MNWTDERVEKLKKLWSEGLSASQIAAQLGGVSRNAVIGKVHRLALPGRAKAGGAAPAAASARPKRPVPPVAAPQRPQQDTLRAPQRPLVRQNDVALMKDDQTPDMIEESAPVETPVAGNVVVPMTRKLALTQLTDRTCKWPIGDPMKDEFHFCGNDCSEGSPYCTYHARLAYQPSAERRRVR
ncbi:GcrA cell cycle regulator [Rhizobium rhizosphaerae]|uniref:GcrA cell cycle regulator n=1 Tax=Xaviernesmea rhizosphaerae TaxID=1672749 RepID=A0A1Q9AEE9_9HYPH|nr:GcrA family cell cycle regulator [Xaviernesmea rhizosphaerae]OLP53266.1 GcrA cell cycle regulator [Xaviernesmea rhizosphaerae]OQP85892.1 GcrA cell cycle regulator [Xaviernesmea rhizosphaerae]